MIVCRHVVRIFRILPFFLSLFVAIPASSQEKPEIFVQTGHAEYINAIAFSPDGRYALSGSDDCTLRLWDISTGREIRTFKGHKSWVRSVDFSPDGRYALSGGYDCTLKLWDISTGKEIRTFIGQQGFVCAVTSVAFSPDGKYILSAGNDKSIKLWDVETGDEMRVFRGHTEFINSVVFLADSRHALSGSDDKTLKLWDLFTGKEIRTFSGHGGAVNSVAISNDGKYALSGSADNTVKLWDVSTGKEIFTRHTDKYNSVAISPDGRLALSGDYETIRLWDISTGKEIWGFKGSSHAVVFSNNGKLILSVGGWNTLRLLEADTGKEVRTFKGYADMINSVAFSPDGKYALSAGGAFDYDIKLWDISSGKRIRIFKGHTAVVHSVVFSPDGKYILSASTDKTVRLWDISKSRNIKIFNGHTDAVSSAVFSPDGKYALSGSWDKTIKLWDVTTGKEIRTFEGHKSTVTSVVFSPDGKYAVSGGNELVIKDADLKLWDVATGKEIRTFKWSYTNSMILSTAFSPDGKYVATGGADQALKLWDVSDGKELKTIWNNFGKTFSIVFSPDGKYILSGGDERAINLWDVSTAKKMRTFEGHTGNISSVAFSSNGRYVLSGSSDGTTRIWDASTGKELAQLVSFRDNEWIIITPEGYYNSSLNGHKYLNIRVGNDVYGIDQFYDVFYRPDIVTAKLRGEDISSLITLTIDEAIKNPPPSVAFTSVPSDTDKSSVKICYQVKSTGGGIGELRLFHNGKLIHSDGYYRELTKSEGEKKELASMNSRAIYKDFRSIKIKAKGNISPVVSKSKGNIFEDCKEVDAISGWNDVSISAFNENNTVQSSINTANFNARLKPEEPHLYILSVGINEYRDKKVNLQYAVKDATDIKEKFPERSATLYKPESIHNVLLTDKEATRTNILTNISELSTVIRPSDSFVLFVAGHGVLIANQYYMLTNDYDGRLSDVNMISSNEIIDMSKKIKSLNQLFIFDTCYAGGVDMIVSGLYDARMSVLAKKMGLHIFASASSVQEALDGYEGNGLFTHALLDGLNNKGGADRNSDGKISIIEFGEYSKQVTTEISKKIGHPQTPLIINFGKDNALYKLR